MSEALSSSDPNALRDIAEAILSTRQYEVWLLHIHGYDAFRIAQVLRLSPRTVERELHAIRLACREAEAARKEGPVSLSISTQTETDSFNAAGEGINPAHKPDLTASEAHRRLMHHLRRSPSYS